MGRRRTVGRRAVGVAGSPPYAYRGAADAEGCIMLTTVLIVILVLLLVGAVPRWGYSAGWGYGPSGILTVVLIVVLILLLTGRL